MKKVLLLLIIIALILTSCEREKLYPGKDIILKIGKNLEYGLNDFDFYDLSTHSLYFETDHPEIDTIVRSYFEFYVDSVLIYRGAFKPPLYYSYPIGLYIYPYSYPKYVLRIKNDDSFPPIKPDLRNDPRLIAAFKNNCLLRNGLSGKIHSVEINGSNLDCSVTVTNRDQSSLLIMNPDKMGFNLFYNYIRLQIISLDYTISYLYEINPREPSTNGKWEDGWLARLDPGASETFEFSFSMTPALKPGKYIALLSFPGLSREVTRDQLYQENGRIWLGDLDIKNEIVIK